MIERIFDPILAPFRWLRSTVFGIKQAPTRVKGELSRAQAQVQMVQQDFQGYKQDIGQAKQKGQQLQGRMQQGQQQGQGGMQQGGMPQQGGMMPQQGMPQQGGMMPQGGMPQGGGMQPQGGYGMQGGGMQMQGGGMQGGGMYGGGGGQGGGGFAGGGQGRPGQGGQGQGGMSGGMQGGMMNQGGGMQPGMSPNPGAGPKKMGFFERLFGGKKKCPSCGQKLHKTWTECPFCGWGRQMMPNQGMMAPMPQGGKNRTIALDMSMPLPMEQASDQRVGWFIPLEGQMVGELLQIRAPRTVIGKSPDCNIVVNESSISGHHAEFVATANGFRLNDLGSTNGTWVNDKRVSTHDLVDNDNVRLGRLNFKYKSLLG